MRVLVTGANGFVGSALCSELRQRGVDIVEITRDDVTEIDGNTDWGNHLNGINVVLHLAGRAHILSEFTDNPKQEFLRVNTDGTRCLAKAAQTAGVARFILLSSALVHGNVSGGEPFTENRPANPQSDYAYSKLKAEQALSLVCDQGSMEWVVLRPPLVYGPGVKANFLRLMESVRRGWILPFAGVKNQRDLIAVRNLVDVLILCTTHEKAAGKQFLVSDGIALSTANLVRQLAASLTVKPRLVWCPTILLSAMLSALGKKRLAESLLGDFRIDIAQIRTTLGWQPPITMQDELNQTAKWFVDEK